MLLPSDQQTVLYFMLIYIEGKSDPTHEPMSICLISLLTNNYKIRGQGRYSIISLPKIASSIFEQMESW